MSHDSNDLTPAMKEAFESKELKTMTKEPCLFDSKRGCIALVCYTKQECNSRDEKGNPAYTMTKMITKYFK